LPTDLWSKVYPHKTIRVAEWDFVEPLNQVAKLFINGRSQALRLPAAFQFDTKEVFIRKDPLTGDVILSRKPGNWDGFFSALKGVDVPADFLDAQERNQETQDRDLLEGWGG